MTARVALIIVAVWTVLSFPFAVLLGRLLAGTSR